MEHVTDFLVAVTHAPALDITLKLLPDVTARVVGMPDPVMIDGYYVVRVFGDPSFFLYAMQTQSYCRVLGPLESFL